MKPLTEAEDVSEIAFAFMGSKALFAALHLDLFTHLDDGPLDADTLSARTGVHPDRIVTLLTALASLGLVVPGAGGYGNAPAAATFLSRNGKYDFGDYLRFQIDRQMYPFLEQLNEAISGTLPPGRIDSYEAWMSDPEEARIYSRSQHAGSLGPARALARMNDLSDARRLLDVGGGTGAFAITLCTANPALSATIVDFPNVAAVGRDFIFEAGLSDRIVYREGNALETDWPDGQDVVVMSYLLSSIPGDAIAPTIRRAWEALAPGGRIFLHDFMVNPERSGPKLAALWQLQHTAFNPGARSVDTAWALETVRAAGFGEAGAAPLIPGMTTLVSARKPA